MTDEQPTLTDVLTSCVADNAMRASAADDATDAMEYTQACVNAANTLIALGVHGLLPETADDIGEEILTFAEEAEAALDESD